MLPLATPRTWVVGEVVTAALMNAELRDQMNALRNAEEVVIKPSDEPLTSSTSMQNDNHLLASLAANALYVLTARLAVTGSATGDFKMAWTLPSGATAPARFSRGPSVSTTGSTADSTLTRLSFLAGSHAVQVNYGVFNTSDPTFVEEVLYIDTAATAGTAQLTWAQNASSATATTVVAGSFIECRRIG
ncbi:hypothetical protein [Streptomyces sp. NPDC096153]|uniref:hypothetical protein n=1 Tax=Streptomyces sp. NPDC096153 TaxID=3155548 RepID=UPI003316A471